MSIFSFIQNVLDKREGIKQYEKQLIKYLEDGKLSDLEKEDLEKIKTKYDITVKDIEYIHKVQASTMVDKISFDQRITNEERESLHLILVHFGLTMDDFEFNRNNFNKYYTLALIDKGILPIIDPSNFKVPVILKEKEVVYYGRQSNLVKNKKIVSNIYYGGLAGSIRITKGIRYKWGTLSPLVDHKEIMNIEDSGVFYVTNQRLGFIGNRKQFALTYNKISGLEIRGDGLYIFKEGKEIPYIVTIEDYDVPMSIVSSIMN